MNARENSVYLKEGEEHDKLLLRLRPPRERWNRGPVVAACVCVCAAFCRTYYAHCATILQSVVFFFFFSFFFSLPPPPPRPSERIDRANKDAPAVQSASRAEREAVSRATKRLFYTRLMPDDDEDDDVDGGARVNARNIMILARHVAPGLRVNRRVR